MRETLTVEVEDFLRWNGPSTATQIAVGIRARRDDVDEVLKSDPFKRVSAPSGCSPKAAWFNLSYLVPARPTRVVSRADRMLEVLQDGRPHSREEIFERVGFMLTNNAASELREQGYEVEHRVERRIHTYQLVDGLDEAPGPPGTENPLLLSSGGERGWGSASGVSSNPDEPEAA